MLNRINDHIKLGHGLVVPRNNVPLGKTKEDGYAITSVAHIQRQCHRGFQVFTWT